MYHAGEQARLMCTFHVAVWGLSTLGMVLPLTTKSYGSTGAWCWITASGKPEFDVGTFWRYAVLYVPVWVVISYNIMLYARIARMLRRFSVSIAGEGESKSDSIGPSGEQQRRMYKFGKRLLWYPAVLIGCWAFATIQRIQNAVDPTNPVFWLLLIQTSTVGLQGFFNALVYGMSDTVQAAVLELPCIRQGLLRLGIIPAVPDPDPDPKDENGGNEDFEMTPTFFSEVGDYGKGRGLEKALESPAGETPTRAMV
ncbi:unnamed protein product [Discosporangium mesarthrocarpum]